MHQYKLNNLILIFLSCFLISCQTTYEQSNNNIIDFEPYYLDSEFIQSQKVAIETEQEVFELDVEMKEMVANNLLPVRNIKKRAKKLLRHIFSKENIDLAYQSTANLTAIEAYHNQTANCMSLTIMAYALAKEADLDVKFQDVKIPEYWIRNGGYNMLTGHVNLVLTEPSDQSKSIIYGEEILQIDFDPSVNKRSFAKRIISKSTVLSMFYNNKGADAIVDENYALAYAYIKKATEVDPLFSSAWGNLGILYKVNGFIEQSIKTYELAIKLDNDNLTALGNLAYLLKNEGLFEEALAIEKTIHNKRSQNPYYYALLADEAYFHGNNELALKHFKKAIRMDGRVHEFYFGIAKVFYALNDITNAEKSMEKALTYNRTSSIESQYTAKLNFLRHAEIDN